MKNKFLKTVFLTLAAVVCFALFLLLRQNELHIEETVPAVSAENYNNLISDSGYESLTATINLNINKNVFWISKAYGEISVNNKIYSVYLNSGDRTQLDNMIICRVKDKYSSNSRNGWLYITKDFSEYVMVVKDMSGEICEIIIFPCENNKSAEKILRECY